MLTPLSQVRPEGFASVWLLLFRVSKLWGPRQQILKIPAKSTFSHIRNCHTEP